MRGEGFLGVGPVRDDISDVGYGCVGDGRGDLVTSFNAGGELVCACNDVFLDHTAGVRLEGLDDFVHDDPEDTLHRIGNITECVGREEVNQCSEAVCGLKSLEQPSELIE